MTNLELVIDGLVHSGWTLAGTTRQETVRIPTMKSPIFGHGANPSGGELATFGGRQRFRLPSTDWFVSVGDRTVCFYRKGDNGVSSAKTFPTSFIGQISSFCESCK
jgi:hypothetical protein